MKTTTKERTLKKAPLFVQRKPQHSQNYSPSIPLNRPFLKILSINSFKMKKMASTNDGIEEDDGVKGPELYGDGKTRKKSKPKKSRPKPRKPSSSAFSNGDEQQSVRSSSRKPAGCTIKVFEAVLDQLSHKLKPNREEALSTIVQTLTNKELGGDYVDNNFATLLYLFTCRFRKGSVKEIQLASQAIGLLAISIQDEDSAHEVYQESLPVLSQAMLKSCSKSLKVFDALALVTLFGTENSQETERSMQIIWEFLKPESGYDNNAGRISGPVVSASISAWSVLLSTIDEWRLSQKSWQGAVSYLSGLLKEDDDSVYAAAGEALALIFEMDCLEKFMSESDADGSRKNSLKQELMDTIAQQVRVRAKKQEEKSVWNPDLDVLKFFEGGTKCLQTSAKIGGDRLNLSTWAQRLQLNFIRSFIGKDGIAKQMKENKNLRKIFEFVIKEKEKLMYSPIREELKHRFYDRRIERKEDFSLLPYISSADKKIERRMNMSPCSMLNKGRTQLLNKKRMLSMETVMAYHFADDEM